MRFVLFSCAVALSTACFAGTPTDEFLQSCRDLHQGRPGGERCEAMQDGTLGAFDLIGKDYYPVSAQLGYCLPPDMTPVEAATAIIRYADKDPDCAQL